MISSELLEPTIVDTTILMPIGGQATRAQLVTGDVIPKHLIPLGDRTVLDVVVGGLQSAGFTNFLFCVGHHKDKIREHIEDGGWIKTEGVQYAFSEEDKPLGVDGAILNAIGNLGLSGQGMIVPGDVMLPWKALARQDEWHRTQHAGVTIGVTSYNTARTTDVGKMIVEDGSNRIIKCYARDDVVPTAIEGVRALTCAAATSIDMQIYADVCRTYLENSPSHGDAPISMRDQVAPWAARTGSFIVQAYDIEGEVLDLGTPENIAYGQAHWEEYV